MEDLLKQQIETAQKLVGAIKQWEHYIAALQRLCTHAVIHAEALETLCEGALTFDAAQYTGEFMPLMGRLLIYHLYDVERGVWVARYYSDGRPKPISSYLWN